MQPPPEKINQPDCLTGQTTGGEKETPLLDDDVGERINVDT